MGCPYEWVGQVVNNSTSFLAEMMKKINIETDECILTAHCVDWKMVLPSFQFAENLYENCPCHHTFVLDRFPVSRVEATDNFLPVRKIIIVGTTIQLDQSLEVW